MPCAPKQGNWIPSHPRLSEPNRSAHKASHFLASCGTAVLRGRSLIPDRDALGRSRQECSQVCVFPCVCVCLGFPRFDPWLGKIQEKDMVAHFCILTRTIPWTEELGGLRSMGSHTAGHDSVTEHVCIFRGIHLDSFAIRNGIYFLIYFHKLCSAFQN